MFLVATCVRGARGNTGEVVQVSVFRMNQLRTPAVLLTSSLIGYAVSVLLATFTFNALSYVVEVLTYCVLALLVSWLILRYGNGSDDVISAIDGIADFMFAMVC